ncbi:MAG: hypothetical protein H6716_22790 [Polyangiaceae bacterium]|nr:hypothetical protein [Polyangiaceae bacterium]
MTRLRSLLALFVLTFVLVTSVLAWTYRPVAAAPAVLSSAVLRISTDSLTDYLPTAGTAAQDLCLADEHRGVGMNGVPLLPAPHGLMMGANPIESGGSCSSSRVLNGVDLVTGVFTDTQVYMNLPTLGSAWSIGATYSSASSCGSASDGYQGKNWATFSAPEVVYEDRGTAGPTAEDFLYIVYGADRYVEFQRDGTSAFFLGVNGAGGVVEHNTTDSEYIYYDILGTEARFFAPDHATTKVRGQLWKVTSGNERVCSVGSVPTARTRANAIAAFDASGRPTVVFDGSGRRFTYDYTSGRLDSVVAEIDPNGDGDWSDVEVCGQVDFSYYGGSDSQGSTGDLGFVKVTTPVNDSYDLVAYTHYRYYQDGDDDGEEHELKMVVQAEGVRRYGLDNPSGYSATLAYYDDVSDSALYSYATHRFEYNGSGQIISAWFAGDCGCSGGSDGKYEISYGTNGTGTSGYDTAWRSRAIVKRPDATYLTQYFDEVGQELSTVITSHEPGTTPTSPAVMKTWVTRIERDASGRVYEIATPANASNYSHSTGVITPNANSGLVNLTTRFASPSVLEGFPSTTWWRDGDAGTTGGSGRVAEWVYGTRSVEIGTSGIYITRPVVEEYRDFYDAGSAQYDATEFEYKWRSMTSLKAEAMRTRYPAVPTTENGSGVALEELQYFDEDNQLTYSKATDGIISQFKYDSYGQVEATVEDVDYADAGSTEPLTAGVDPSNDWDFSSVGSGTPFHHETAYTHDCVGRVLETTLPSDRVTKRYYSMLADGRQVTLSYPMFVVGTGTFHGPVDFTVTNQAGKTEESGRIGLTGNTTTVAIANHVDETDSAVMDAFDGITGSDLVRRRRFVFNDTGTKRLESHLYFDLTFATGYEVYGQKGVDYDVTYYHHDDMGRQIRVEEPSGTIYRTNYDVLGRPEESFVGTNDNGKDGGSPSGTANMVATEITEYDGGSAGGNSLVTSRIERTTATSTGERVTSFSYDDRDRLVFVQSPTAPHSIFQYDYRGRRVATGAYSSLSGKTAGTDLPTDTTSANRLALSESSYDMLGRVWKTTRHEIVQSTGNKGDSLIAESWFDAAGRLIKHQGAEFYKVEYDRIGRVFNRYEIAETNGAETYADADDVAGDIVLEESQLRYDDEGNVILSATIMRHHNDKGTGETTGALDANSEGGTGNDLKLTIGDLAGRAHISASWYDSLGRLETSATYGTYGDSTFDRDGKSAPSATASTPQLVLVTKYEYGSDGSVETVTDENGTPNHTKRDAAGRVTAEIRNYSSPGDPDDDYPDVNIRVNYTYEDGLRTAYIADRELAADDQVTEYTYGTTKGTGAGESQIATGHLLQRVVYPDGDTTSDNVTYAYNAQGEQTYREDQAGNVLERVYDDSGRLLDLKATYIETTTANFNADVQRISRTYDGLGRTLTVGQYDADTGGTLVDQVSFTYDDWGLREDFTQDVNGEATGGVYTLTNEWEKATGDPTNGGRRTLRLKKQEYPSDSTVEPQYLDNHNRFDLAVSRVTALKVGQLGATGTSLISYDYLGGSWAVRTEYLALGVQRSLHDGAGSPATLTYDALDSLGRITHERWEKVNGGGNDVTFFDVDLTYESAENVLDFVVDNVTTGFDVDYAHDGAQRLVKADEGTLDSNGDMVTSPSSLRTRYQDWELDALGNWENMRLGLDSDLVFTGTGELDENREHNEVNELTDRGTTIDLVYDAVGNLTDDGENYKYEYDVFGRQTSVLNQSGTAIANYRYNGLGYLIRAEDVSASEWTTKVYDGSWRVLARYVGSATIDEPTEEYVYHRAGRNGVGGSSYVDLVALRWRDTDASGDLDETIYYCQDRLANVVVVLDSGGSVLEWVGYSAYGVPFMTPPGDMDGDGTVTSADLATIGAEIGLGNDPVKADMHLDGDVTTTDAAEIRSLYKDVSYGRGVLSDIGSGRGYKGYELVNELSPDWFGRARRLDGIQGRWITRDFAGYADGASIYQAFIGRPMNFDDPGGSTVVDPSPAPGGEATATQIGPKFFSIEVTLTDNGRGGVSGKLQIPDGDTTGGDVVFDADKVGRDDKGDIYGDPRTTADPAPNSGVLSVPSPLGPLGRGGSFVGGNAPLSTAPPGSMRAENCTKVTANGESKCDGRRYCSTSRIEWGVSGDGISKLWADVKWCTECQCYTRYYDVFYYEVLEDGSRLQWDNSPNGPKLGPPALLPPKRPGPLTGGGCPPGPGWPYGWPPADAENM